MIYQYISSVALTNMAQITVKTPNGDTKTFNVGLNYWNSVKHGVFQHGYLALRTVGNNVVSLAVTTEAMWERASLA